MRVLSLCIPAAATADGGLLSVNHMVTVEVSAGKKPTENCQQKTLLALCCCNHHHRAHFSRWNWVEPYQCLHGKANSTQPDKALCRLPS